MGSLLFSPLTLRGLTIPNRATIPPLCQYSAHEGMANDWHIVQLGRFAVGGFGLVFSEVVSVLREGRITHGDVGLWNDDQVAPLKRITDFIKAQGSVPAIQLGHAGRKGSMQRPWEGNGPLGPDQFAKGETTWDIVSAVAKPLAEGHLTPAGLDAAGMARIVEAFATGARRARAAGFEAVEVHCAHGYLLHQFLSPISNTRNDAYGGDLAGRMRFPLDVIRAVREAWPEDRPVFVRISAVDGADGGWTMEDSLAFAAAMKPLGVDVVDCSSGGIGGSATGSKRIPRGYGFQVPYAAQIRRDLGLATMAVGLIIGPHQAEAVLAEGEADLVAVGREAMNNPNWALMARAVLEPGTTEEVFSRWPAQHGWWMEKRAAVMEALGAPPA
ncbi:NADH:flavin oxidoreductase/NADH oxidase [Roseomonas sp. PWR1]|uniref:NADH:flavin oxidoreductase/NADH oxidase n=1 Tax=Roseomonas nitratireducens TaxID=2820810 RepID=A0ABS4AQX0_9PROT|nr:NADH:flavin oxidoreductase/NADH oxidase [Neoroseomonas nitratireducens]MBP0463226.1 NADH:flavin oxidoreductase/NADH oxidase [Neoroseomonas nitratireducens]